MSSGLDSTKTPSRPSAEAVETTQGHVDETPQEELDRLAMDGAKRAQNRIHDNETKNPGNSIFTK